MDTLPDLPIAQPPISVVAQRSLFRAPGERDIIEVPYDGATLLDLALRAGMLSLRDDGLIHLPPSGRLVIAIDGEDVPRQLWHLVKPKPGHLVNIYLVPQNQRQAILVGASIAIAIAAFYTGGLAAGAVAPAYSTLAFATTAAVISASGAYDLTGPFLP